MTSFSDEYNKVSPIQKKADTWFNKLSKERAIEYTSKESANLEGLSDTESRLHLYRRFTQNSYYTKEGFRVFNENYLAARGTCCKMGCRHCPYGLENKNNL